MKQSELPCTQTTHMITGEYPYTLYSWIIYWKRYQSEYQATMCVFAILSKPCKFSKHNTLIDCSMPIRQIYQGKQILWMRLRVGKSGGLLQMIIKPERPLDTLHATHRDLYPAIYRIICIFLTMPVLSATSERSFSAMRSVNSFLRSNIADE